MTAPPYTERELQARTMLATWMQTKDGRLIQRAYETLGGVRTGAGMEPTPYEAQRAQVRAATRAAWEAAGRKGEVGG